MTDLNNLRGAARAIFETALSRVDARTAIQQAVTLDSSRLNVVDTSIDLAAQGSRVYAIAIGKAAPAMAEAIDAILGSKIISGVISGPTTHELLVHSLAERWQIFAGGHPLPNQESLRAAQAAFDLLQRADRERALVLFLISGGGSAMIEWPADERITLNDLQEANRLLVSCGASIAEINAVRRAFSAVKGGLLAARALNAAQISLLISDTNPGDEASVASGPTINPTSDDPSARTIVASYEALAKLPVSVRNAIDRFQPHTDEPVKESSLRKHYVLLDNRKALEAAAEAARHRGFVTEVADDLVEQKIADGCSLLLARLVALQSQNPRKKVCLISGGEFLCPVRGEGLGGRNAETVLRCAIEIDKSRQSTDTTGPKHIVVLSAGTDGLDGNSGAAGAIADERTIGRARSLGLNAPGFLETSDAFSFFNNLGGAVITGATGTNLRDVRILMAC